MTTNHILKYAAIVLACALPVMGNGFYTPYQSSDAAPRGNAFVATANTAAAVYYNAAGLTQLNDQNLQVGIYGVNNNLDAKVAGTSFSGNDQWEMTSQIYFAKPLNNNWVLGFGINSPFGLNTEWGNDSPFRNAFGAVKTEITNSTFWAVAGYKVSNTFSVGFGMGVSQLDGQMNTGVDGVPVNPVLEFNGDDNAVSWTISARWQPHEQHAFGLVYRSRTDYDLKGKSKTTGLAGAPKASSGGIAKLDFPPAGGGAPGGGAPGGAPGGGLGADAIPGGVSEADASLGFMTPATLAVGYSYRHNSRWNIEANIEWVQWEKLDTLTLKNSSPLLPNVSIPFNWNNSFIYGIGATYQLDSGYNISFGYSYMENSQPDKTFTPAVSDANRQWLSLGVGRKIESWSWDLTYQYAFSDRSVKNTSDLFGDPLPDGDYKSRIHSVGFSVQYDF